MILIGTNTELDMFYLDSMVLVLRTQGALVLRRPKGRGRALIGANRSVAGSNVKLPYMECLGTLIPCNMRV